MKLKRMVMMAAMLLLAASAAAGCVQTRVLERLGLVIAAGYDEAPGDKILGTSVLYEIDPGARERSNVITSTAYTSKGLRYNNNAESRKKLTSGQLRVIVYHEDLARKGLTELVDTMLRDPEVGSAVYLAISKGRAYDLMTRRYPEISNIGEYLFQSIQHNVENEEMVSPILHEYIRDLYSPGKDPVLPYIVQRNNEIILYGAALFRGDRMVATLPLREIFYLRLLREPFRSGMTEIGLSPEALRSIASPSKGQKQIYLVLDSVKSESRIRLTNAKQPAFTVQVHMSGRLQEISSPVNLRNRQVIEVLEREASKAVQANTMAFIAKTQKLNVDPVGFGQKYRAQLRGSGLTADKWKQLYPKAKVRVEVVTTILRTGQTD
ncbi:Ger(x)C family spore germination protein [Paenibacillus ehimensis]|uniref:Ger(x)C family spore germination protein n=1 Tax=Paenibacillus ehimensis TaxID=79264 RepID=UPI002DB9C6D5|nr:Ger(x)C family spore germination protein [Paenibacillus ehimensis]MEC0212237.1 Ger(x)C family spore germination protein [Paenibacillus ehimensis]